MGTKSMKNIVSKAFFRFFYILITLYFSVRSAIMGTYYNLRGYILCFYNNIPINLKSYN